MSHKKPSDELKRICLICGCHTSQAINIYEPRRGPNIVELIQAKFKFQPVNEDKYLCFSCNNWLINWHSLQNLHKESGSNSENSRSKISQVIPEEEIDDYSEVNQMNPFNKRMERYYFYKRSFLKTYQINRNRKKKNSCSLCRRPISRKYYINWGKSKSFPSDLIGLQGKCLSCTKFLSWRAKYSKALLKEQQRKLNQFQFSKIHGNNQFYFKTNLVNRNHQTLNPVDEKVVAMLRRLGTTLTRESEIQFTAIKMTQPKKREFPENEILIDFNTVITEVFPVEYTPDSPLISAMESQTLNFEAIYNRIPKSVTVSTTSNMRPKQF